MPITQESIGDGANVGAALRDARKRRGMSLEDVANATKIRVANLRAIEGNRRDELPEPIYLRGFVRAYAHEVGLDPDDAAKRYLGQFARAVEAVEIASTSESDQPRPEGAAAAPVLIRPDRWPGVLGQWLVVASVVVVTLVAYRIARRPDHTPAATQPSPAASAPERGATGTAGSGESAPAPGDNHVVHLEIRAGGPCWISATADGSRLMYGLMQPGERHAIDVRNEAVLRVGDPSAFAMSINGRPGRSLGRPGEPVTVHITRDNYREFLQP